MCTFCLPSFFFLFWKTTARASNLLSHILEVFLNVAVTITCFNWFSFFEQKKQPPIVGDTPPVTWLKHYISRVANLIWRCIMTVSPLWPVDQSARGVIALPLHLRLPWQPARGSCEFVSVCAQASPSPSVHHVLLLIGRSQSSLGQAASDKD